MRPNFGADCIDSAFWASATPIVSPCPFRSSRPVGVRVTLASRSGSWFGWSQRTTSEPANPDCGLASPMTSGPVIALMPPTPLPLFKSRVPSLTVVVPV